MVTLSNIVTWYFSKKALPYWCILFIDLLIVFCSLMLVFVVNNGAYNTLMTFWPLTRTMAFYTIFYLIGFKIFHTYSGVLRYSSFIDLQRCASALILGCLLSVFVRNLFNLNSFFVTVSAWTILYASILSLSLMWALRILVKTIYDTMYGREKAVPVMIYGVRQGGISIAKSIRNQDPPKYKVVGFVSDSDEVVGRILQGVKVYPNDARLSTRMWELGAKALFVSPFRSETLRENPEMVNSLIERGIKIYMVPAEEEWDLNSDINHNRLREVQIEDLLPRQKIEIDMEAIGEQLNGSCIMITGAAGSIGSEIVRQVSIYNPEELILIDQAETPLHDIRLMMKHDYPDIKALTIVVDITNRRRMEKIFAETHPEYVFHAAAYKHVPMMEDNPSESIRNNVEGTRIIADLSVSYGATHFVMVSTDKAVNPTNVMGCSKRICEIYVQSLDRAIKQKKVEGVTRFVTTRFGNVLGSNGSVIPLFREQIRRGESLTVTHPDIIRYFMLIPEACKLVLEAGTKGNGGEIFVFDMGKPVKIVDLARRMIKLSGSNVDIKFTGLRDGEKLYEEVLSDQEKTIPTFHPKIKIAMVREYDYADVCKSIDELIATAYSHGPMAVVACMKELVPEFKSQHSVYEQLDKQDTKSPQ